MDVTTLPERKRAEAARRRQAADEAVSVLRDFARANGGRFVVFGSYVTGQMRYDSDLDLLVDFPAARSAEAWHFAERLSASLDVRIDLQDAGTSRQEFVDRISRTGLVLE